MRTTRRRAPPLAPRTMSTTVSARSSSVAPTPELLAAPPLTVVGAAVGCTVGADRGASVGDAAAGAFVGAGAHAFGVTVKSG